ncbi:MAG: tetratricopeptide repeat protein, partial [Acidobacteriota bacterium]
WHISGKQYQVNLFSANAKQLTREIGYFLKLIFHQFTPLGLVGVLSGLWALWQRQRNLFWLLLLIIIFDVAYALNYEIAEDKDAYYLTTHLALAIALGVGAKHLFDLLSMRGAKFAMAIIILLAALPPINFAAHYFENNKRNYTIARDFVENTLNSVAPGGLLMTLDWQLYSPYLYLRHVENYRRDITVVDVNLVRRSWYVEGYLPREYPEMMKACAPEAAAFLEDLKLFEQDKSYDVARINARFLALLNAFIEYHLPERSAHLMLPMEPGVGTKFNWVPQGLTIGLYEDKVYRPEPTLPLQLRGLLDGTVYLDEVVRAKVIPTYAVMAANRGKYLTLGKQFDAAMEQFQLALKLDPELDRAYEFMGDSYALQNRVADALAAYEKALLLNPSNNALQQRIQALRSGAPVAIPGSQP